MLPIAFATALLGCAGPGVRPQAPPSSPPATCSSLLAAVDAAAQAAGVADGSSARIAGHPELRATRFLCGLGAAVQGPEAQGQWLALLERTARTARAGEIANLPESSIVTLPGGQSGGRATVQDEAARCSALLLAADQADVGLAAALTGSCAVPDDYSLGLRTVGLYPLTAPFVLAVSSSDLEESRRWFAHPERRLPRQGLPVRFVPAGDGGVSREEAAAIVASSRRNPLRVPFPDAGQLARLAEAFAPVVEQDVAGLQDRPGRVEWRDGRVAVDPEVPLAYFYPSWALRGDAALLQLNYVFWYAARTGPLVPSLESGPLDGLVARVTLGSDGLPLAADFMLACGCYRGVAPVRGRVLGVRPRPSAPDPFAPVWLEDDFLPGRLVLETLSGWHRVEGARVSRGEGPAETVSYRLADYAVLESLPAPGGARASVFDPAGVVKGTARAERWILFPMGIPSVGSLRQRGRQPTRLVGREHFDDPRLLERDLELP